MKALIICNNDKLLIPIIQKINNNYDIIVATKCSKKNEKFIENINKDIKIISIDVASTYNCKKLYKMVKDENINIIINCLNIIDNKNFYKEKIDNDLDLIDLNIKATHTIIKLFLTDFEERNDGVILNIYLEDNPSVTLNASKNYVSSLTSAISEELKRKKSNVKVKFLCTMNIQAIDSDIDKILNKHY